MGYLREKRVQTTDLGDVRQDITWIKRNFAVLKPSETTVSKIDWSP